MHLSSNLLVPVSAASRPLPQELQIWSVLQVSLHTFTCFSDLGHYESSVTLLELTRTQMPLLGTQCALRQAACLFWKVFSNLCNTREVRGSRPKRCRDLSGKMLHIPGNKLFGPVSCFFCTETLRNFHCTSLRQLPTEQTSYADQRERQLSCSCLLNLEKSFRCQR